MNNSAETAIGIATETASLHHLEAGTLWAALVAYFIACVVAIAAAVFRKRPERTLLALLAVGVVLHTTSFGIRWVRLDQVPMGTMFEMLSANVWGLMLALFFAYWKLPPFRPAAVLGLPVVLLLMGWMLMVPWEDAALPPTYHTIWLFVHIGFIKLFLGASFVALALAVAVLLRHWGVWEGLFTRLPGNASVMELAYRFLAAGLIFDTVGIIAGAIWAQNAWGRYWSWDRLEVWSLLTWLTLAFAIHLRSSMRPSEAVTAAMVVGVFVVAFLTFFGIPFFSDGLHKGAI